MRLLCVHQGAELYGSDRSFALSIQSIRKMCPDAFIAVVLPCHGDLVPMLEHFIDELIIEDVGTMQRNDFKKKFKSLKHLLASSLKAWKRIRHYDVIYINTIVVFGYMLASIFTNKLVINHVREIPSKFEARVFSLLFFLNRSYLIFNSNYTRESFINNTRGSVVLNGVKAFTQLSNITKSATFNILLIGRIIGWKGQLLAIEVIDLMASDYPQIRLRIVGSTAKGQNYYIDEMLALIKKKKLESFIEYKSFDANPSKHFYWSDVTIVPSLKPEPFGRVAIESLASSKPVIASNHGGLVEIIKNDYGGYLFNSGDKDDLKNKLTLLLDDKSLLKEKSKQALDCYNKRFSEEIYIEKFSSIFNEILSKNNISVSK